MAKEPKTMSVIEIPLKTEKWQEDVLFKRFEMMRKVYNAMLGYELKQYRKMERDKRFIDSKAIINEVYKISDKEEKKNAKESDRFKEAADMQKALLKEYGISEFAFTGEVARFIKVYSANIPSAVAGISIAKPMWAAFQKCLFGNGEKVSFKKFDSWKSVASDGKSGLRILNEEEKTVFVRENKEKLYLVYGKTTEGKLLRMPLKIDRKDTYLLEMLSHKWKIVRIGRKKVRGKYKYFVQLTVEGAPAIKYDKETGEIKNPINEGRVGVYIDTTTVVICSKDGIQTIDLSANIPDYADEIAEQQRIMDEASRRSNPDNYNADGTIKKGIMENGKRRKLRWVRTNVYKEARNKAADLKRVETERRKIQRYELANLILSYGSDVVVNDYPFQYAAMRKKFEEGEELSESGRPKKKRKKGAEIGHNAPATLVTYIDQKLKSAGYQGVTKVKLSDVDYSEGYRQFYAKELFES